MDTQDFDPRLNASDVHNVNTLDKASFVFSLCKFIIQVIKVNREEYPTNTFKELVYCIQMYLHSCHIFWFILDGSDIVFLDVFYVLDNEMKKHTTEGLGILKSATPISVTVKDKMWKEGKLGEDNGMILVQTVLFLLGVNLRL